MGSNERQGEALSTNKFETSKLSELSNAFRAVTFRVSLFSHSPTRFVGGKGQRVHQSNQTAKGLANHDIIIMAMKL